jgi:hypothetical protein
MNLPKLSFRPKQADAFSCRSLRERLGLRSGGISLRFIAKPRRWAHICCGAQVTANSAFPHRRMLRFRAMALPPDDARSTRTPRAATPRCAAAQLQADPKRLQRDNASAVIAASSSQTAPGPAPVNWRTAAALLIILLLAASAVAWLALHRATATKAPAPAAAAGRLTCGRVRFAG